MGLKSPSDGRWDGRGRTGFVTSPCTEKKRDALIRTFWHRSWLMGDQPLADGTWTMMDRTPPVIVGRFLEHVAAC
jgi:hypothetical protein